MYYGRRLNALNPGDILVALSARPGRAWRPTAPCRSIDQSELHLRELRSVLSVTGLVTELGCITSSHHA
jgi:hypothetical protein